MNRKERIAKRQTNVAGPHFGPGYEESMFISDIADKIADFAKKKVERKTRQRAISSDVLTEMRSLAQKAVKYVNEYPEVNLR